METIDIQKFEKRTNKSVRLIAIHTAKKDLGGQLERILLRVIEPTRKEDGNIAYVLHRSLNNADELMFDEIWVEEKSLELHLKQPYIQTAIEQMGSILARPVELKRYSEIRRYERQDSDAR